MFNLALDYAQTHTARSPRGRSLDRRRWRSGRRHASASAEGRPPPRHDRSCRRSSEAAISSKVRGAKALRRPSLQRCLWTFADLWRCTRGAPCSAWKAVSIPARCAALRGRHLCPLSESAPAVCSARHLAELAWPAGSALYCFGGTPGGDSLACGAPAMPHAGQLYLSRQAGPAQIGGQRDLTPWARPGCRTI